jgi:hypothetical protein
MRICLPAENASLERQAKEGMCRKAGQAVQQDCKIDL